MRSSIFAALLVLASPLLPSEIRFGPERPVGPQNNAPAYRLPNVASNGRDYFAVWSDGRRQRDAAYFHDIYGSRLSADGRAVEPLGRRLLRDVFYAGVVASGDHYVIGWTGFAMPVDEDGAPLAPPRSIPVGPYAEMWKFLTNGTDLLMLTSDTANSNTPFKAVFLDQEGDVISSFDLPIGANDSIAVAANGRGYTIITRRQDCAPLSCAFSIELFLINSNGIASKQTLTTDVTSWTSVTATSGGDRVFIAWRKQTMAATPSESIEFAMVDNAGGTLIPQRQLTGSTISAGAGYPPPIESSWDGRQFILLATRFSSDGSSLPPFAWRVGAEGSIIDPEPMALPSIPSLVFNGSTTLVLWQNVLSSSTLNVVINSFDELSQSLNRAVPSFQTPVPQSNVRLASGPRTLRMWVEGANIVGGVEGGTPITIVRKGEYPSGPVLAHGSRTFLVCWTEGSRLFGARISDDGELLDQSPLFISDTASGYFLLPPIAVAYGDSSFLVVWAAAANGVYAVRVGEDGRVLDDRSLEVSDPVPTYAPYLVVSPQVVWTGRNFLVAWSEEWPSVIDPSHAPPPPTHIDAVRVTSAGTLIGSPTAVLASSDPFRTQQFAMTWTDDRATLTWIRDTSWVAGCLVAAQISADLALLVPPRQFACVSLSPVVAAWNGSELTVLFAEWPSTASSIRGLRLDAALNQLDSEPFTVSPANTIAGSPDIVPISGGFVVAYDRISDEEKTGGIDLGYTRTLTSIPVSGRRRVTHH